MKKIGVGVLVLLFLLPSIASAHTYLEESNPGDGETVTSELDEIEVLFDTPIQEQSQLEVLNENNEPVPISDLTIEDDIMYAFFDAALPNGTYTAEWNIIGEDGHPTNGEFTFEVDVADEAATEPEESVNHSEENETPLSEDEVADEPFTDPEETEAALEGEMNEENAAGEVSEEETENDGATSGWIIAIVVILGILALLLLLILRRKRS